MNNKEKRVLCETPTQGKKPTRIHKWKYDVVSQAILNALPTSGDGVLFKDLPKLVFENLDSDLRDKIGSIGWYTTTVKLDLECKQRIERVKGASPQRLLRSGVSA